MPLFFTLLLLLLLLLHHLYAGCLQLHTCNSVSTVHNVAAVLILQFMVRIKGKVHPEIGHEGLKEEKKYTALLFP